MDLGPFSHLASIKRRKNREGRPQIDAQTPPIETCDRLLFDLLALRRRFHAMPQTAAPALDAGGPPPLSASCPREELPLEIPVSLSCAPLSSPRPCCRLAYLVPIPCLSRTRPTKLPPLSEVPATPPVGAVSS